MYEGFGASEIGTSGSVRFSLFLPDNALDPTQYEGARDPHIGSIRVVGDFQSRSGLGRDWQPSAAPVMARSKYPADSPKGWLYSAEIGPLPPGFYEYKYHVLFEDVEAPRYVGDPCSRYGGVSSGNSGFVVDRGKNRLPRVRPARGKRAYADLVVYELMLDDFTALFADGRAPIDAVEDKLDYLREAGFDAIEFMPWTDWACEGFSWGYDPYQFFSVAHRYTFDAKDDTRKLARLARLVDLCHARGMRVIMDGVFNHADAALPDRGFAYYLLYRDPSDSPYIGEFAAHDYFRDIEYDHPCALQFIADACMYWIEEFGIDGIRFDNTMGMYEAGNLGEGLPKLIADIKSRLRGTGREDFSFVMEHSWDYAAIDAANKAGATSCWYDRFRQLCSGCLGSRKIDPLVMRMLNSGRDFDAGRAPTIYVENHDHEAFVLKAGGRDSWALTRPYVIALFACRGAVLVHNGQEFGEDYWMPETGEGRVVPRPLRWDRAEDGPGRASRAFYSKLIALRKVHPAMRGESFVPWEWDERRGVLDDEGLGVDVARNVALFRKRAPDGPHRIEELVVALNFSSEDHSVAFRAPSDGAWIDLLSGERFDAVDGALACGVPANYGRLLARKVRARR